MNDFITITELESELAKNKIFPESKNLIESLALLSIEERQEKIKYYNKEVVKNLNLKKITPDAIDLGTNIIVDSMDHRYGLESFKYERGGQHKDKSIIDFPTFIVYVIP